jgi:hypothetical protein
VPHTSAAKARGKRLAERRTLPMRLNACAWSARRRRRNLRPCCRSFGYPSGWPRDAIAANARKIATANGGRAGGNLRVRQILARHLGTQEGWSPAVVLRLLPTLPYWLEGQAPRRGRLIELRAKKQNGAV